MSTETTTADVELVTSLLTPHWTQADEATGTAGFAVSPGEAGGDVRVEVHGDDRYLLKLYAPTIRDAGYRVAEHDDHLIVQLWPYDAKRDDPLTALRIPVVSSPYPSWKYEVALVISEGDLWPGMRPTDAEVRQIAAYIGYRMEWYNEGWRAKMRKRPLDTDSGTNTVTLLKRAEGDWCYRRMTFQHGPWPFFDMEQRFTLEQLLDHIHLYGDDKPSPKWLAWKAAHPEAFPAAAEEAAS